MHASPSPHQRRETDQLCAPSNQIEKVVGFIEDSSGRSWQLLKARNLSFDFAEERQLRPDKATKIAAFCVGRFADEREIGGTLKHLGVFRPQSRDEIAVGVRSFIAELRAALGEGNTMTSFLSYRRGSEEGGLTWSIHDANNDRSKMVVIEKTLLAENHLTRKHQNIITDEADLTFLTRQDLEIFMPSDELRASLISLTHLENWRHSAYQNRVIDQLVRLEEDKAVLRVKPSEIAVLRGGMRNGAIFREPGSPLYEEVGDVMHRVCLRVFVSKC